MEREYQGLTLAFEPGLMPVRAVYVHGEAEELDAVRNALSGTGTAAVSVSGYDWNRDLSPWPAEPAFKRGEAFRGEGPSHLRRLTDAISALEADLGWHVESRCLAGYSLAGLFALFAGYECGLFESVVSASGSLWYDGFPDYMQERKPHFARAYLSLGDREPVTRNPRLASVGECTLRAADILRASGVQTQFEWNPGNHFQDAPGRLARGILALEV